jgi:hypothetical protein
MLDACCSKPKAFVSEFPTAVTEAKSGKACWDCRMSAPAKINNPCTVLARKKLVRFILPWNPNKKLTMPIEKLLIELQIDTKKFNFSRCFKNQFDELE